MTYKRGVAAKEARALRAHLQSFSVLACRRITLYCTQYSFLFI